MALRKSSPKAFTLIEVAAASVITFIMGLSIIMTITHTLYQKQFERERAVALNRATIKVEELKRALFPAVEAGTENIMLDVHNTPNNTADDIPATLTVELFDKDTNISIDDTKEAHEPIINLDREADDVVEVRVTVSWVTRGKTRKQTINTRLAP